MTIQQLCSDINLPEEMTRQVLEFDESFDYERVEDCLAGLNACHTRDEALKTLKEALGPDENGARILGCMLHCAALAWERYKALGIGHDIYVDTMKCFTRFMDEHYAMAGKWAFDRDWWTARQVSLLLFRVGALEYEMITMDGRRAISIHIPSDAAISDENCLESYAQAKVFFRTYFPEYGDVDYVCHSWLLSPALKKLLPEQSNIIRFQNRFEITAFDESALDYLFFVFKVMDGTLETLPENTSLQRNMKAFLLDGGKVGAALGRLREEDLQA